MWKDFDIAGLHITLAPNVRYHWQHSAEFYTLEADPVSEFHSDDFRLSAYGAISTGIDIQYHHRDISIALGFSQYLSAENWGLTGKEETETPSSVHFITTSLGWIITFRERCHITEVPDFYRVSHSFKAMGSPCHFHIYHKNKAVLQQALQLAQEDVERLEKKYSRFLIDSELSMINQSPGENQVS